MQIGRVAENIRKRSVLKQIGKRRTEVTTGANVWGGGSVFQTQGADVVVTQSGMALNGTGDAALAVHTAVNALAASGAEPVGVMAAIMLPQKKREKYLREQVEEIEQTCLQLDMELMGECTQTVSAVNRPTVTITCVGKQKGKKSVGAQNFHPGDELVMTKWTGMAGTAILAREKKEKLSETLPQELIDVGAGFWNMLSVIPEAYIALAKGAYAMHPVKEGGVFGALWEIGEASHTGITVDLMKIPIRQETIEICEVFGLNPYQMLSEGALLIGCTNGNYMIEKLKEAGIEAAVIGRITDSNDKIVVNGEETRFIEPASGDEIYKVIG